LIILENSLLIEKKGFENE